MSSTHLSSENCEIEFYFIKSDSQRPLQERPQNSNTVFSDDLIQFSLRKRVSIINSFHTIAPNKSQIKSMHPYTQASRAFQKYQEPDIKSHGVRDLSMTNKTKQTTLLHRQMSLAIPGERDLTIPGIIMVTNPSINLMFCSC